RLAMRFGAVLVLTGLLAGIASTQDPSLDPEYGSVKLKAGFTPDPYVKKVVAGGEIKTNKGDVVAYVAKKPDFKLFYTAGEFPLTIYAESKADTTLLINLPDGTWVADD